MAGAFIRHIETESDRENMSSTTSPHIDHRRLSNGIELAVQALPTRPVVAIDLRFLAGCAFESPDHLGVAHIMSETITKGSELRDGRAINDAFDAIGATHNAYAGRETAGFTSLCLPEFVDQAVRLLAEMIRKPSFPEEACEVAVELSKQSLAAMEDDPTDLAKKILHRQAYGDPLGRHILGEESTIASIGQAQIVEHWRRFMRSDRMMVSVAGNVAADDLAALLEAEIGDPPASENAAEGASEVPLFSIDFKPVRTHHHKEIEQEQIAICFPGSAVNDDDYPVEQVVLGILAGGMSGRLFTEVREKQGLVYWVGAWGDQPRAQGILHLGASTTPQNVEKTFNTLLHEIERLGEDVTDEEIARAKAGLITRTKTRGDVTRAKATETGDDLFYHGRPIPTEEKLARVNAVTVADIRTYLDAHPRDRLSVVTLGPKELQA
jgi:predicted Zn-dependent peptidase